MSQNKMLIRKNRNLVLWAILEIQGKNNAKPVLARQIGEKLNIPPSTYQSRLYAMTSDGEIKFDGTGYLLDAGAFKHISVKKA